MKKIDYANIIVRSPAWGGIKDPNKLAKAYKLVELKDMYDMLNEAEADYYGFYN